MTKDKVSHVSMDLWQTLIKSNSDNKKFATQLWAKELGYIKYAAETILSEANNYFTKLDEITGRHSTLIERYHYIYSLAGIETSKEFLEDKVNTIYPKLEEIFLNNPPSLYDENTRDVLLTLKDKGITTNILSNTGNILGSTLNKSLEILGISNLFDFKIYSDKVNIAKPDEEIFELVIDDTWDLYGERTSRDILHIGDNLIADGGCIKLGIQFLHINSNSNNTIKKVLNYV